MPLWTVNGYDVELYHGDGDGSGAITEASPYGQGPSATVQLQTEWAGRYDVFTYLQGYATGGSGSILRVLPIAYPPSPNLFCLSIGGIKGIRYKGGWDYERCQFTAEFGVPSFTMDGVSADPSGKLWTTTRSRVSAEVTTVPTGTFYWTAGVDAGTTVADSQLGILAPRVEVSMTRHMMPYAPIQETLAYIGSVNASSVTLGNRTFDAGHLLFAGANITETADVASNRTYEVEYVLMGASHDWNALLDKGMVYRLVNTSAGGGGNYPFSYLDYWDNLP